METVKGCNLFDTFTISPFSCFRYNFDGPTGKRVLFIESEEKHFTLSFEEGMSCLDVRTSESRSHMEAEYKNGKGYIHQLRTSDVSNFVFFHFEYHDSEGKTYILPGQMRGREGYTWSESEVEPILVEIMNSITLNEETKPPSVCAKTEAKAEKHYGKELKALFLKGGNKMKTSKKIISLLMCMLMVLTMVPMSVFAVEATEIDTINIEGIPAPVYGQTVKEYNTVMYNGSMDGTHKINGSTRVDNSGHINYGNIGLSDWEYYNSEKSYIAPSSADALPSVYYLVHWLYPAAGYKFSDDVAVTVDGAVSVETELDEEGCLAVWAKYEVKATIIDEVNLTYDASVIDLNTAWTEREVMYRAASNVAVKTDGVKFSEYAFMAYKNNDGTLKGASSQTEMIDASREYYIQYDLATKEGYDWIDTAKVSKPTGITVILNGEDVTSDVIFQKYNEYYNSVEMWVPLGDVSTTPIVTELSVAEKTLSLEKGGSHTIQGEVKGTVSDKTIIWTVEGATSTDTTIDNTGKLTIGTDETASILTVKATANADSKKVVNIKVTVLEELPYISTVTVSPETASVYAGGSGKGFYAKVEGTQEDKRVIWTVEGNTSANTVISDSGWLNVGEDETASILTIKATAEKDNTKVGSATVTVLQKTIIKEVNLTYDLNAINLNDADTEGEVQQRFINSAATTTEGIEIVKDSVLDSSLMFVLENGVLSEIGDGTNKVNNEREYILKYILDIDYSTHDWEEKIKNDDFSDLKVTVNGEDITANVKKLDYIIGSRELYVYLSIGKPSHAIIPVVKVSATCVNTGKEAYYTCNGCGKNFEDDAATKEITDITMWGIISATGIHTYENVITKATLSTDGKIESKCSVCGDVESTETIAKIKSVTLSTTNYIYNGKNKTPKVTVKDANGKTLVKNVDYKTSVASKRSGIGRYTVKVTFIGNYSGSKNVYFYIKTDKPATVKSASQTTSSVKLSWSAVPGAAGYTVYRYSPSKKAYVKAGTTEGTSLTVSKLYAGTKYTFRVVSYGKTSAGKVYDSDTYALLKTATKTKTPELTKVTASAIKGKAYVYHSDVSGETGYTVYYSTKKDSGFKKYANFKADTTRCDITKLTSGKTYYFKVRTYIKTDSGYVYSAWSAVKSVKVK